MNLIAHSKGGLESRYLISCLGMGHRVASLTTIGTPHHGAKTMDHIVKLPDRAYRWVARRVDGWFRKLGDTAPQFYQASHSFTTAAAQSFNQRVPDDPGVYYRSYGAVMGSCFSDLLLWFSYLLIYLVEGENDGMVPLASARWTNFQPVLRAAGRRGISHCDEVDLRRCSFSKKTKPGSVADISQVYLDLVQNLKTMNF